MVAIFHSNSPKSISCTSKKVNLFQKAHVTSRTESKELRLDITSIASTSTSSSDRYLITSPNTTSKNFYLSSKESISNSLIPNLTSVDNISTYQKQHNHHSRLHSIPKIHKNSISSMRETANSADIDLISISINKDPKNNNSYQDSLDTVSNNKKAIDIQSFKNTIFETAISITPPSTTPSTPITPSSKDSASLDKSISSLKNSIESSKYLLKLKNTPTSQTSTPILHSTTSHYTRSCNNNKNNNCINIINHPKIDRSRILNNTDKLLTSTMHSNLFNTSSSIIKSNNGIYDNSFSNGEIDSNYIKNTTLSISHSKQNHLLKSKRNLHDSYYKISDSKNENIESKMSVEYKSLCMNLIEDLSKHADSGQFLNSLKGDIIMEKKYNSNNDNNNIVNDIIEKNDDEPKENDINSENSINLENIKSKYKNNKVNKNNTKLNYDLIKENINLNIIQRQLKEDKYSTIYSVFYDLQQMLLHCYRSYFKESNIIHRMGKNIENYLIEKIMEMPEDFLNELKDQCINDYQRHRKSLKSSSSYPVLSSFLKAIELPMLLEDEPKYKEDDDIMATDENHYEDSFEIFSSTRHDEQIKLCKKKEKEKLCLIFGKNNKIKIIRSKGKSVEGSISPLFETSTSCTPSSSTNKKPIAISFSKKRKYNQYEKKEEDTMPSFNYINWNMILKKIPKSYHFDTINHINKKIRYINKDSINIPINSYPKLLTYTYSKCSKGKLLNRHSKYKNYIIHQKRFGQCQNCTFHRNNNILSSKNFIFYISSDILKNSPWAELFHHFTNQSSLKQIKLKASNTEAFKENAFKSSTISSSSSFSSSSTNIEIKDIIKPDIGLQITEVPPETVKNDDPLNNKIEKGNSVVEMHERKELNDILITERSSSSISEFNKEDLIEKEKMKCLMNCNFLPPTPPSSSPPSSPMKFTEEDEEIKDKESQLIDFKEKEKEKEKKKEKEVEKDKVDLDSKEEKKEEGKNFMILDSKEEKKEEEKNSAILDSKENRKINKISEKKIINGDKKGKGKEVEDENEKKEILFTNKKLPAECFKNKTFQLNPIEWMEAKRSTKAFTEAALNSLKRKKESLTTLLIRQQIQNIIDTQMLIDHLNMNRNDNSLPPPFPSSMYPLNSLDMSLTNIPNLTNIDNSTLPSPLMNNTGTDLSITAGNEIPYDATNDFFDWDKVNNDNASSLQGLGDSTNIDATEPSLSLMSSTNPSLLTNLNSATTNFNHFNYYNDDIINSLMYLPSSTTSTTRSNDFSSSSSSTSSSLSLMNNVNDFNNLNLNNFANEEVNPFVNNITATPSSVDLFTLASKALDLNSSLLNSSTTSSLNSSDVAYNNNSIPYSSKLLANEATISLMNTKNLSFNSNIITKNSLLTDSLLLNPLDDSTSTIGFNNISSNLRFVPTNSLPLRHSRNYYHSSNISSTPPSVSYNSTLKYHHRHITSSNLFTTASNIATSLTAASKLTNPKTNQNKIHRNYPSTVNNLNHSSFNLLTKKNKNKNNLKTSSAVIHPLSSSVHHHSNTTLSKTLGISFSSKSSSLEKRKTPTTNNLKVSIEANKKKEDKVKTPTEILDEKSFISNENSSLKVISKESSNLNERVTTNPGLTIKSEVIPTLPTPTSDVMLGSGSNEKKEAQESLSSHLPITPIIGKNSSSNEISMPPSEFLNPSNFSCYDLLLNLSSNCNEPLISEMANHETIENININNMENEKSLNEASKDKKDEKKDDKSSKKEENNIKIEKEVSLFDKVKEPVCFDNVDHQITISKKTIQKDVSQEDSFQFHENTTIDNRNSMEEDPKETSDKTLKIEKSKQKQKRITISFDFSHGRDKRKDEVVDNKNIYINPNREEEEYDNNDNNDDELEDMEEDEETYDEEEYYEEESDYTDDEIEESDNTFNDVFEEEEEEDDDDDEEEEDVDVDEDEDENSEEEEEEDNDDDDEFEEEDDDEDEEEEEEEESTLSLMEMKRIKQQQNQNTSSYIKNNIIKINPPLPKIIVHTKKEDKSCNKIFTNIIINTNSNLKRKINNQKNGNHFIENTIEKDHDRDENNINNNTICIENNNSENNNKMEIDLPIRQEFVDVLELNDSLENIFDIESLTPENLIKIKESILLRSQEKKNKIRSNIGSLLSKEFRNITNKKEKVVNLSELILKESKNRKIGKKHGLLTRTIKKVRGRNALKVHSFIEANNNKNSNITLTSSVINSNNTTVPAPTRGKGRPKGQSGKSRKRWSTVNDQIISDQNKNYFYSINKENKDNKFKVEENGNTLYIKPEFKEKSNESIVTQVSVTTTSSIDPIAVITSTVPSSVITSTRNSHFYSSSPKQCTYCGSTSTPLWRHGPPESPRLCNSCGVKWKRGKILQSQPSGFPWNSISVDKKTEEFRALMRCVTSEKVLKVLGILKTCMTIAMRRQLERGEEVKIDIRNIDSRAWCQLYRYIKCQ
ncbi:hypothetical protein LY90DRAFT_671936 [Neocallimastix californiae]|jgi:hypothetical protein|uniref:GATA-type domain-containing protein n=1 Tax=Neocallimastix californiae TaxID=1754190 RepID=A0A1Y2C591_9FUNG|nr:hypothetical protein LY90DRAFT_671936 [Neocallimastix californiae]|eukprot:ORY42106.1 hypothetical protein LY90DRAFT_671936 [Neocallimastix californiae]